MKRLIISLILLTLFVSCKAQLNIGIGSAASRPSVAAPGPPVGFFAAPANAFYTKGVFTTDTLVRSFEPQYLTAGLQPIYWDGTNDRGETMPNGNYTVRIIKSNIITTWEGAGIGNTSRDKSGPYKYHVYGALSDMIVNRKSAVILTGYSEIVPSIFSFNTDSIQVKKDIYPYGYTTPRTERGATDSTYNYYVGIDDFASQPGYGGTWTSFIYATKVSDNTPVAFSSGEAYNLKASGSAFNILGKYSTSTSSPATYITSVAAQAGLDYIFYCVPEVNAIYVLSISQGGSAVRTINSFTAPRSLACDGLGHLWVTSSAGIGRYTINSDGTLTSNSISITGISNPGKISVNNAHTKVGVIDYDTQQLKEFSNSTGASAGTPIGVSTQYSTNAAVLNNKFYVSDHASGFTYAPDNSIWLADGGNNRFLHFTSAGAYIEQIQIQHPSYFTRVDNGDTHRVFSGFREFLIDYTQPLTGSTGWSLANNWDGQVSGTTYHKEEGFRSVHTYTVGGVSHTFAFIKRNDYARAFELVELQPTGVLRFTGILKDWFIQDTNGDLLLGDGNMGSNGNCYPVNRYAFTGAFDGSHNPVWNSTAVVQIDLTSLAGNDLAVADGYANIINPYITSDNKAIGFNNSVSFNSPHVAVMNKGGNKIIAKSAHPTYSTYYGDFPSPYYYDQGNNVNNNNFESINISGNIAVYGYHGEFWKANIGGGQSNRFNIYHSSGVPIGQFGTDRFKSPDEAAPEMEGNALTPQLVAGSTSDEAYLYHGGESDQSGLHRWHLTGLNSVTELTPVTITNTGFLPPVLPGINLLTGQYFGSPLSRSNGWTGDAEASNFTTILGRMNPLKTTPDIYINCAVGADKTLYKVLQSTPATLTTWSLTGNISWLDNVANNVSLGGVYVDILDNAGKAIASLYQFYNGGTSTINANDKYLMTADATVIQRLGYSLRPFTISRLGSTLTFTYNGMTQTTTAVSETGADITKPTTLRLHFFAGNYGHKLDLDGIRFVGL